MQDRFKILEEEMEKILSCKVHDLRHVKRVYKLATKLAHEIPDVDMDILKAATLLHDIGRVKEDNDPTGKTDHAKEGAKMAKPILQKLGFSPERIEHIQECIITHRYRTEKKPNSIEAKILFDADKIDTNGATGILRGALWLSNHNANFITDTDIDTYIRENLTEEGRIKDKSKHSYDVEYEYKQKNLHEHLYTKQGKEMAKRRAEFTKLFIDQLRQEFNAQR